MKDMSKIPYVAGQFDEEEQLALIEFEKFSKYLPKIFDSYTGTPSGTRVDVFGTNITGGCEYIELKKRDERADKFEDCFIEPEKYTSMMNSWDDKGCFPIYINFIGDYKNVYLYYLPEVSDKKLHKNVRIRHQNGLYSREDRYGLPWNQAHHYLYNETTDSYIETKPVNINKINKKASQWKRKRQCQD